MNNLAEDIRKDLDNPYSATGELPVKSVRVEKPRNQIGYKRKSKK